MKAENKKTKLTWCVCVHDKYSRTENNIKQHEEMAKSLSSFDVDFVIVNTSKYGNWGGMSGLLSNFLDTNPKLDSDGYLVSFEDDFIFKDEDAIKNAIEVLENRSKTSNLAYVGHAGTARNEHGWKQNEKYRSLFGEHCKWTDGGCYIFKVSKLLEIKEKLGVLPGHTKNGVDYPLKKDNSFDFSTNKNDTTGHNNMISEHEVGFPTRLCFHGYEIYGIKNQDIIRCINTDKEEI